MLSLSKTWAGRLLAAPRAILGPSGLRFNSNQTLPDSVIQQARVLLPPRQTTTAGPRSIRLPVASSPDRAAAGKLSLVRSLVEEYRVPVNPRDRWNNTPTQDALGNGHPNVAEFLRGQGGLADGVDDVTQQLLSATSSGALDVVERMLKEGVSPNVRDYDKRTALHLAAGRGDLAAVRLLLAHQADVNAEDRWGYTPIQDAARSGHIEAATFLRENGAHLEPARLITSEPMSLAMHQVLDSLATPKYAYAAAWIRNDKELLLADVWHAAEESLEELARMRAAVQYSVDPASLVRQTFEDRKPHHTNKVRAADLGLASTAGTWAERCQTAHFMPVTVDEDVVAVLGFYSAEKGAPDAEAVAQGQEVARRLLSPHCVSSKSGVSSALYASQRNVEHLIDAKGMFSRQTIQQEVDWYYNHLGLDSYYFRHTDEAAVADHLTALITAKLHAASAGQPEQINYVNEYPGGGVYICASDSLREMERRVERKWLGEGYQDTRGAGARLGDLAAQGRVPAVKFFMSQGSAGPNNRNRLAFFLVSSQPDANETSLWNLATATFLRDRQVSAFPRYQALLAEAQSQVSPAYALEEKLDQGQTILTVAYRTGSTHSFLSATSQLIRSYNIDYRKAYVDFFSNGYTVHTFYFDGLVGDKLQPFLDSSNLTWILPRSYLSSLVDALFSELLDGKLSVPEMAYAYCGWKFAYHFLAHQNADFDALFSSLAHDPQGLARLSILKKKSRMETATEARCAQPLFRYPELVKLLFSDFKLTYQGQGPREFNSALWSLITRQVSDDIDRQVLRTMLDFNAHLLKTNFFKSKKSALSFRLDPRFLRDYKVVPYGLFYMQGSEFRGFHLRFNDVARGGVRLIPSRSRQHYQLNAETLFDENYNLALTQQLKNKDIPEGGSKGTILLTLDHQKSGVTAFRKYVDSLLDLLLPHEQIKDHYGKNEVIFLGPDEGTADVMDWASKHAATRGYPYARALTTGKTPELGGIPHDTYGMTTQSVHTMVLGLLREQGLREENIFKMQTGGPDGDLGSNEILISKDRTKAVVDGSGVVYDPAGLDRTELSRLAKKRVMISEFDTSKLGPGGFRVLVDDTNVKLPDGQLVANGLTFRNSFHLNPLAAAEFFVPCGGRPGSININNVDKLPMYGNIVEGANLFISQEARLRLHSLGVNIIKDASANKGGVTSSSCEVLAALAMTPEEHQAHMCKADGVLPAFYQDYVKDTQARIQRNAEAEFACIWREAKRLGLPHPVVSDRISTSIDRLNEKISQSQLWQNKDFVKEVLTEVLPPTLVRLLGMDSIIQRLPTSYLEATLSAHFASKFVYEFGITPDQIAFYKFMRRYKSVPL